MTKLVNIGISTAGLAAAIFALVASAGAQVLDHDRPAGRLEPKADPSASGEADRGDLQPETPADQDLFGRGDTLPEHSAAEERASDPEPKQEVKPQRGPSATIHLASYHRPGDAMDGWSILRERYTEHLSSYEPILSEVDLGERGRFIRLLAGPLADEGEATELCRMLNDRGAYCTPADVAGNPRFARKGGQ
jgi:hypothetical protein